MTGRLFRFTPHGGKPNHYTDSLASATAKLPEDMTKSDLAALDVGDTLTLSGDTWERIA